MLLDTDYVRRVDLDAIASPAAQSARVAADAKAVSPAAPAAPAARVTLDSQSESALTLGFT